MSENKITTTIIGEDGSGTCIRYAYINKDNLFSGMYDGAYIKLGNESRGSSGAIKVEDMYQAFKERMIQEIGVTSIIQSTYARGQHIKSELIDKGGDNHGQ